MINDETQETVLDTTVEDAEETRDTDESSSEEDSRDWKAEALKYKAILDRNKSKKEDSSESHSETYKETKSDGFGYDVKAYLKASGIQANEFDFVKKELKSFGGSVDDLIENDYFQSKLTKHREVVKTSEATPKARRSGTAAVDTVDYWMNKPFEEVPREMRPKVIEARMQKEKSGSPFYNR